MDSISYSMGFLTCIDHLKLSVCEMFSKRFVDRGPVKTYNTYIYIHTYTYTYIHISKERLEWLGKCVQNVEDLLFFKPSPVGNARNVDMK